MTNSVHTKSLCAPKQLLILRRMSHNFSTSLRLLIADIRCFAMYNLFAI